jgi:pimeloyl-ACP methyl ester carboxylesterase
MNATPPESPEHASPRSVVLVHGAWHGGWCFDALRTALAERGVIAAAPDLPGHGDDQNPPGDVAADAAAIATIVRSIGRPVVLMGHSYGGLVISEVVAQLGEQGDLGRLVTYVVYLCALALPNEMSFGDLPPGVNDRSMLGHMIQRVDGGSSVLNPADPEGFRDVFAADCDLAHATRSLAKASPQMLRNLRTASRVTAPKLVASTYVVCTEDMAIPVEAQRAMVASMREAGCELASVELVSSHSPYASMPGVLADLLVSLTNDNPGS